MRPCRSSLARTCEAPFVNVDKLTTHAGYLPIALHHERVMPLVSKLPPNVTTDGERLRGIY